MGRDSHSNGRGFDSRRRILDGHFSHLFAVKIVKFFLKKMKTKRGRGFWLPCLKQLQILTTYRPLTSFVKTRFKPFSRLATSWLVQIERILTYFVSGSIIVRLTSCLYLEALLKLKLATNLLVFVIKWLWFVNDLHLNLWCHLMLPVCYLRWYYNLGS